LTATMKKIVIIGGGAGGLELATSLGHKLGRKKKAEIILVDRNHSHLWKPLLHEVATGSLDDGVDALSYLAHARNHGFNFQIGSLTNIDRETQTLQLAEIRDEKNGEVLVPAREIAYDTLVMALGSTSNDFGTPGVKENCIFLDNPHQAHRFHNEMLNLFLKFSANPDKQKKVNIAIATAMKAPARCIITMRLSGTISRATSSKISRHTCNASKLSKTSPEFATSKKNGPRITFAAVFYFQPRQSCLNLPRRHDFFLPFLRANSLIKNGQKPCHFRN